MQNRMYVDKSYETKWSLNVFHSPQVSPKTNQKSAKEALCHSHQALQIFSVVFVHVTSNVLQGTITDYLGMDQING